MQRRWYRSLAAFVAVCVGGLALVAAPRPAAAVVSTTIEFSLTGASQTFTVPAGVTSLSVEACGASGAGLSFSGADPGLGAEVGSTLAVSPGEDLVIFVGGAGSPVGSGGFNGGGDNGGGGATDVRQGGAALEDRVVVAGGGGGAGGNSLAGFGVAGGNADVTGDNGYGSGSGATATAGGAGGVGPGGQGIDGSAGELGKGGDGHASVIVGAGGGGGLYGGGGAGGGYVDESWWWSGGGGGGSSLADTVVSGACSGDGWLTLTYDRCPGDDQYEGNDDQASATPLQSELEVAAVLCADDADWYSFAAVPGEEILVELDFVHAAGDLDLTVHDPTGAVVSSSSSATDGEVVSLVASSEGLHAVAIVGVSSAENTYRVKVTSPRPVIRPGAAIGFEGDSGSTSVLVPVTLSAPAAGPVSVDWVTASQSTRAGIAETGVDFVADSGTVVFAAGETHAVVEIELNGDLMWEPPFLSGEWGFVVFSNPSPNARFGPGLFGRLGVFVIADDDPLPTFEPGSVPTFEGDSGSVFVDVPVALSNPSAETITVDWRTLPGSADVGVAEAGIDFVAASGTLTFPPGEVIAHATVEVIGDEIPEPAVFLGEWGVVQLTESSANAVLGTSSLFDRLAIFVIVDDD